MEELDRELTLEEIAKIEDRIADYIGWYDAISDAINDYYHKEEEKEEGDDDDDTDSAD